ncbi:MAG: T9SS type A sorting domain-containing protein, partial [Bacteroidota bacterium]
CWKYDAINDNWIQKADFAGTPRSNCVAFTLNGKGIVGLGFDTAFQFRNDFMQYDTAADTWSPFDSLPAAARSGAVAFTFPTRAYVGFGYDSLYLKDTYYYAALNDEVNETVTVPIQASVYPNPVANDFTIHYSLNKNKNCSFQLYDLSGKQWMNQQLNPAFTYLKCNTSDLPDGIYFYKIETNTEPVSVGKLVVLK